MRYASSVVDLIGNTPLLALDRINSDGGARLFGKCEFFNPIAVKDRPVLWMIQEAEGRGDIGIGTTLIEATSGNTGMALAYIGRMRGYRVVLCMSEIQSVERRRVLRAQPEEAPFVSEGRFAPHRMMGTAPGFMPGILDRELIDEILLVSEEEAFETCRELARKEGILVGISSGASVCAALRLSQSPEYRDMVIVSMLCDSGERYLSVEGLFDVD